MVIIAIHGVLRCNVFSAWFLDIRTYQLVIMNHYHKATIVAFRPQRVNRLPQGNVWQNFPTP